MSVLIKGINVRRGSCWECPCLDGEYGDCNVLEKDIHYVSYEECPLIELPDHGDLIDRDEAAHEVWLIRCEECGAAEWACESCDNGTAMKRVMDAPAVIPAERSEASLCDNCDEQSDAGCSWCKRTERSEDATN